MLKYKIAQSPYYNNYTEIEFVCIYIHTATFDLIQYNEWRHLWLNNI